MKKIVLAIFCAALALTAHSQASLVSIAPNIGMKGQTLSVTITGTGTNFGRSKDSVSFMRGVQTSPFISINSVSALDSVRLLVSITISGSSTTGLYTVRVQNQPNGAMLLPNAFTVGASLVSALPNVFKKGDTANVTITGKTTNFSKGPLPTVQIRQGSTNSFVILSRTVINDTTLIANVTAPMSITTGSYTVSVTDSIDGTMTLASSGNITLVGMGITSITPNNLAKTMTTNITFKSILTKFTVGATPIVSIKSGTFSLVVNSVTVQNDTQLVANVTVPGNSPNGTYTTTITDSLDGMVTVSQGVTNISVKGGSLLAISPKVAERNQTLSISITGLYTQFIQDSTTISFYKGTTLQTGFTLSNILVNSSTSLSAQLSVASTVIPGKFTLRVTTSRDGIMALVDSFTVNGPFISSVNPASSYRNKSFNISIFGSKTNFTQGSGTSIYFLRQGLPTTNITAANVVSVNDTQLTATVTVKDTAATGNYQLVAYNITDSAMLAGFSVQQGQAISISPSSGVQGSTVNINLIGRGTVFKHAVDTNFKFFAGTSQSGSFVVNSVNPVNDTNVVINVTILPSAVVRGYLLRYSGKYDLTSIQWTFNVTAAPIRASLLSITPDSVLLGQTLNNVIIKGRGTQFTKSTSGVSVAFMQGGVQSSNVSANNISVQNDSTLMLTVTVSSQAVALGRYDLMVSNPVDSILMLSQSFKVVNTLTGLEGIETSNDVSVYPNPVKEKLTISSPCLIKRVELFDITGRLIYGLDTNNRQFVLDVDSLHLSQRFLILKIQTEMGDTTERLLIE